ncbi:polysaccharide biosynthesis/export family protein [Pelagicoccus sp. SDUM812003]|uniref:polysaccharide biosynthesis/export family protein n=1 Tax=Pelagicoccus sp. SDUM812003 TaxID=3041267 RepID=UPI00280C511A|nr:polysaccharide biosynthesis/export family protein [Pelagicoccus sp. SDUM812003]MDQ8204653.1 polysaccharide biosynthesis/export family protein [Pelagicoccus sp. SDUM812003]
MKRARTTPMPLILRLVTALTFGYACVHAAETSHTSIPILPRDIISITVFDEPGLCIEESQLDNVGKVSIPLLGTVTIGGLTVQDAEQLIEKLYLDRDILKRPKVSLAIDERYLHEVSVVGEVNDPGVIRFPLATENMGILSAIGRAGGTSRRAQASAVRVTRRAENGEEQVFVVDVAALLKGTDKREEFRVRPNDVIFVPESVF